MATVTSTDNLEIQLAKFSKTLIEIKQARFADEYSITVDRYGDPYISFAVPEWSSGYSDSIKSICEDFGLVYRLTPLNNKFAVTLRNA